jgi:hypothetical protein
MGSKTNLVNLDAMIERSDFAMQSSEDSSYENVATISLRDFMEAGLTGQLLRKPDFQRETNHWKPDQVFSLLECFVNGDLIPSVILWRSNTFLFVIDGCHRLSVLKAWIYDDYGDGKLSYEYFGREISQSQKAAATITRNLINSNIGSWKSFELKLKNIQKSIDPVKDLQDIQKLQTVASRGVPIQWVKGDVEKAESSFFKINTEGTPLDSTEELLLRHRKRPIPIAARAVIRAATGHEYWSYFPEEVASSIKKEAKELHHKIFEPDLKHSVVRTLDLPLGGSQGVRSALKTLIDLMLMANKKQDGKPISVGDYAEDLSGAETLKVLKNTLKLIERVTGNGNGSLGLHPAVYFYGESGRHSIPMFMGTIQLVSERIRNNDGPFFAKFIRARQELEESLIVHKEVISQILQGYVNKTRIEKYKAMLESCIHHILEGKKIDDQFLVEVSGKKGKVLSSERKCNPGRQFSNNQKSFIFIKDSLSTALRCPICNGYIDSAKSVSYDHIKPLREGGQSDEENCQITHPYCNQSIKK